VYRRGAAARSRNAINQQCGCQRADKRKKTDRTQTHERRGTGEHSHGSAQRRPGRDAQYVRVCQRVLKQTLEGGPGHGKARAYDTG
jgi:hypothetical protein